MWHSRKIERPAHTPGGDMGRLNATAQRAMSANSLKVAASLDSLAAGTGRSKAAALNLATRLTRSRKPAHLVRALAPGMGRSMAGQMRAITRSIASPKGARMELTPGAGTDLLKVAANLAVRSGFSRNCAASVHSPAGGTGRSLGAPVAKSSIRHLAAAGSGLK